ncbi:hypothetical protein [Blautia obeum]|uniref:hypothetical protein n=1 Tax=Blautia obeum TaxID=40520 RepID=UPI00156DB810|nr:hypothetical protein [Blautia obeum]NSC71968.1 hypothetical protein [Blautia obeum]
MKKRIKFMGIFMALILGTFTAISVSAASEDPYQAVIDKLNKEYSMDIHFMDSEELRIYSTEEQREIDITPEEFEQNLREQIIENNRAKAEADQKIAELEEKDIIESGSGVCKRVNTNRTTATVTRGKKVPGTTVYLNATVSNKPGYWMYSSINSVYTEYLAGNNSKPPFYANTYNYSLIDARRTCATKLYGYTLGDYGTIIDSNAYRYVEFWAGSGM